MENDFLTLEVDRNYITTQQVIDRQTGELGSVTDELGLYVDDRRYVSEMLYATPILDDKIWFSAFGRIEFNNRDFGAPQTALAGGGRLSLSF